jgi:TPR repeat protein
MDTSVMRHLQIAAKSGEAAAQFNLGVLYDSRLDDNGYAVDGDRAQAIKWLWAAAEQGLPRAQSRLAELYADGPNTSGSYVNACAWFLMAADKLARHTSPPSSIRVRTDRCQSDIGAAYQSETPGRTLAGAEPRNPTTQRRASAMRTWFVPPLVVPIFVVLLVAAFAAYRAL